MRQFDDYLNDQLKNDEFKKEFESLKPKYELIQQIIAERTNQNLSQKALAEKIGLKQSHISRLESGNYNPSLAFLQKIAEGLGKKIHIVLE
ncbi:MAG TPA: helix-turn-helix transcriptional regulator [Thermotogota bacterium]|nr:helix-turn-helix transcriptional regulator [Thermotogota bacterium]